MAGGSDRGDEVRSGWELGIIQGLVSNSKDFGFYSEQMGLEIFEQRITSFSRTCGCCFQIRLKRARVQVGDYYNNPGKKLW